MMRVRTEIVVELEDAVGIAFLALFNEASPTADNLGGRQQPPGAQ